MVTAACLAWAGSPVAPIWAMLSTWGTSKPSLLATWATLPPSSSVAKRGGTGLFSVRSSISAASWAGSSRFFPKKTNPPTG